MRPTPRSPSTEIGLKRIAMICARDAVAVLPRIDHPTLVLCGEQNHCTPVPLSEEIAAAIPRAELFIFPEGGELIELEMPDAFAERVRNSRWLTPDANAYPASWIASVERWAPRTRLEGQP